MPKEWQGNPIQGRKGEKKDFQDENYIKTFFMINPIVKTIELPDGRTITLETGKLAKQADGMPSFTIWEK